MSCPARREILPTPSQASAVSRVDLLVQKLRWLRLPGMAKLVASILERAEGVDASAKRHFESRYGLLSKPALVRFRVLDRRHRIGGLTDITVPASQFASAAQVCSLAEKARHLLPRR